MLGLFTKTYVPQFTDSANHKFVFFYLPLIKLYISGPLQFKPLLFKVMKIWNIKYIYKVEGWLWNLCIRRRNPNKPNKKKNPKRLEKGLQLWIHSPKYPSGKGWEPHGLEVLECNSFQTTEWWLSYLDRGVISARPASYVRRILEWRAMDKQARSKSQKLPKFDGKYEGKRPKKLSKSKVG